MLVLDIAYFCTKFDNCILSVSDSRDIVRVNCQPKFKWSTWPNHALFGVVCRQWASTCCSQPIFQIWSLSFHPLRRYDKKCQIWGGLGSLKVTGNSTIRQSANKFLVPFHSNYVPILPRFWDIEILVENCRF